MSDHEYIYLEARPHRWRRQLHIRGSRLSVAEVLADLCNRDGGIEGPSELHDLPLEAILEAIDYGTRFAEVLEQDAAEEARLRKQWLESRNEQATAEWLRLLPLAQKVLGNERAARQWLRTPNPALGNEQPVMYAARSTRAYAYVCIVLHHIKNGDYGAL